MSLLYWWPFNGNLTNKGLGENELVSEATYSFVDSTLGKSINLTNGHLKLNNSPFKNSTVYSICGWVNLSTNNVTRTLLCSRTHVGLGLSIFIWQNNQLRLDASINYTSDQWTTEYSFEVNKWNHFCITNNNGKLSYYVNGELKQTKTVTSSTKNIGNFVSIGESGTAYNSIGGNQYKGQLYDFRIYDNILNKNEIKDIYNNCILHYSFDREFINDNLIVESNKLSSWVVEGCTKEDYIDDELGNCLKITSNKDNGRIYRNVNNVWMTREETFTVSFWARSDEDNVLIDASRSIADFSKTFNLIKEWRRYVGYIKIWGISSEGTLSIRIHSANKTIYIKDVKLEKGNNVTNWCPNKDDELYDELGFNNNVIYDESGYELNGIQSKLLPITKDSIIGINALDLTSGDYESYIKISDYPKLEKNFTWNVWIKQNSKESPTKLQTILSQGRDFVGTSTQGADCGFNIMISNGIPEIRYGNWSSSQNNNILLSSNLTLDDQWHMLTGSIDDNGIGKIYVDGILIKTADKATSCSYSQASGNLIIGKLSYSYSSTTQFFPFNGYIDDIKLFATCLSDIDVKNLYKVKMKIDKNNNIYTNNFVELRQNSFYFDLNKMSGWHDDVLSVVNYTAKSISFRFNKQPVAWESRWFPLEEFLEDRKTYILYIKMNANCNKNLEDGTDNQYARTYGIIGIHKYKISDNTVVKSEIGLRKLQLYTIQFTVDYSIYKNYELRFYPNCIDTTSWNNGDYIYDYIDIVPIEENYNTNISKKSCLNTGEFLENNSLSNIKLEKYNRTNITEIIEI